MDQSLPGMSACNLCIKSLTLARTSSRTPYIDPVVSNDIVTSNKPPGGNGTDVSMASSFSSSAVASVSAPLTLAVDLALADFDKDLVKDPACLVLPVDRTLSDFDNGSVIDSAFFRDSFDTSDVSPMLEPDFNGKTVVTVPSSITTLEAFLVRDGLDADESFFDDAFLDSVAATLAASFSSTVKVEALLNAGVVGDPRSLLPSDVEDPDRAISRVFLDVPTDGIFPRVAGFSGFSDVERLASFAGLSSSVADEDFLFTPNMAKEKHHNMTSKYYKKKWKHTNKIHQ